MSLGDICKSRFWISFNRRPFAMCRWWFSFAPTYNRTIVGLHIGLPFIVVLGHVRHPLVECEEWSSHSSKIK